MMAEFKIESGIPLPGDCGRGRPRKYPFPDMEVGDSFFCEGSHSRTVQFKAYKAAQEYAHRNPPMKFSGRLVEGGIRIWRVA